MHGFWIEIIDEGFFYIYVFWYVVIGASIWYIYYVYVFLFVTIYYREKSGLYNEYFTYHTFQLKKPTDVNLWLKLFNIK